MNFFTELSILYEFLVFKLKGAPKEYSINKAST